MSRIKSIIGNAFINMNTYIALESKVSVPLYLGGKRIAPIDVKGIVKINKHRWVAVNFNNYTELNNKLINYYM